MNEETIFLAQRIKRFSKAVLLMVLFIAALVAVSTYTTLGVLVGCSFGILTVALWFDVHNEVEKDNRMQDYFRNKEPIKTIEW